MQQIATAMSVAFMSCIQGRHRELDRFQQTLFRVRSGGAGVKPLLGSANT